VQFNGFKIFASFSCSMEEYEERPHPLSIRIVSRREVEEVFDFL
jgi:hypothetical protein